MAEEDRETADYGIQIDFTYEEAEEHIDQARLFIDAVDDIIN